MKNTKFKETLDLTDLTGTIVAAYVSNNPIPASELPRIIRGVHSAVRGLASGRAPETASQVSEADRPSPAEIRRSVQRDGIVSFLDGKTYKTLKRHLTANGFTPHSYCERYGLPEDYPLVAPSYSERRSAISKSFGLGQPSVMAGRGRKVGKAA